MEAVHGKRRQLDNRGKERLIRSCLEDKSDYDTAATKKRDPTAYKWLTEDYWPWVKLELRYGKN